MSIFIGTISKCGKRNSLIIFIVFIPNSQQQQQQQKIEYFQQFLIAQSFLKRLNTHEFRKLSVNGK